MCFTRKNRRPTSSQRRTAAARASNWNLASRPRKETVLPEITQLALDGHSAETIARMVGMSAAPSGTGCKSCGRQWLAAAAVDAAEMAALTLARLEAIYREAMQEWAPPATWKPAGRGRSQAAGGRCDAKTQRPDRSQPQRRNTALLTGPQPPPRPCST